ncbi:MAG: hypothetical protein JJU46_02595 [Balneolaceae bacterium]|nr:hypothetical protein [Balneolaceae bacterium]MCH8548292.1 hypothetical protein [Balneolaceae bacterium]
MSKQPKDFTSEEKAAIALKAVSGDTDAKQELAKKHGITVEIIDQWIHETGVQNVDEDEESVDLEASESFADSVLFGAVPDKLNYPRLVFWSVFGTVTIVLMIVAIMAIHDFTVTSSEQQRSAESRFYNIEEIQERDRIKLDSFGVVDPNEGIYRIPIDSAITRIAQDPE